MRIAIFSDIHSNLDALKSILEVIENENVHKKVFLGDVVGYGADPNECVDLVRKNIDYILAGNHDYAAVEKIDIEYFNKYAKEAILWTRNELTDKNKKYLLTLPVYLVEDQITFAHSTPKEPENWHYIMNMQSARENFNYFETQICFIGHSHSPVIIEKDAESRIKGKKRSEVLLKEGVRYIINEGSVGQPRDGNPDAAYCIYDTDEKRVEIKRVLYDVTNQQDKMRQKGLPDFLIDRIAHGR